MSELTTTREKLEKILADFKHASDIEASAIVSRGGLIIASDVPGSIHAESFAALSAAMLGAAETAVGELKNGIPYRIIVEFRDGKMIAAGAGPKALLVVMTPPEVSLGLILVEMEKAAEKVKELL